MTATKRHSLILFLFTLFFTAKTSASYIEVTLLGTGTPRPNIDRLGPATIVETKGKYFLFDTGRGVTVRLHQTGVPLNRIEHIFYTHLHSDHTVGLADLLLTSWIWQRPHKLKVAGPEGVNELTHHLSQAYQKDMHYRSSNTGLSPELNSIDVTELKTDEVIYQQDGIKITAFLVDHGVVKPAFGYKIESDENAVVISGDTTYSENLIKHAKGSKLLVHEIAAASSTLLEKNPRLQKVMSYHTDPQQLAEVLEAVKPDLAVLNHVLLFGTNEEEVIDEMTNLYNGNVMMGKDLVKIGVGEKITIRGDK